jgi:glycosyltransferase involved in cell wall biosynthesis
MRIGVDATCWANPRGYGRFTRHVLPEMARLAPDDTFVCYVDRRAAEQFELRAANVVLRVVELDQSPTTAAAADSNRSPLDMLRLTWAVARGGLDLFFSPTVYTYFPLPPGLRAVVTVHDAIVERFPELTIPQRRARLFWHLKMKLALAQARLILTVSDFAAGDIASVLHVKRDRIRVAVEAPAAEYALPCEPEDIASAANRIGLPPGARWLVYVGGFNPHKHVDALVHAHAALVRNTGPDAPHLVLVGSITNDVFHGNRAHIQRAIDTEGTGDLIHWAGFVEDQELRLIHAGALALVLPSECEGFGLPAVEAAACGTPVVATTESPLPQLLAGGGLFVAPGDLQGLTAALAAIAGDEPARRAMGVRARAKAGELSWDRCARAALGALREAA